MVEVIILFVIVLLMLTSILPEKKSKNPRESNSANIFEDTDKIVGDEGEMAVSSVLKDCNLGPGSCIMNNFTFRNNYGGSVQIDHLVVCSRGVFVLETKNWNAMEITGGLDSENWMVKYTFFSEYEVLNPYIQNAGHIKNLVNKVQSLKGILVRNIVVLAGKGFYHQLKESSKYVATIEYLKTKIERYPEVYNPEEVRFFKNAILSVYERIDNSEHVKNIENYKKWKEESKK
jgi:hypothetical protein